MHKRIRSLVPTILDQGIWLLLFAVAAVFACLSDQFATWSNLSNICVQASSTAVVASGMTFVLLTAGVDLSVGAVMFVSAAVCGTLASRGVSLPTCALAMLATGLITGCVNATIITRLGIVPFIATLGALYFGRGFALWMTETRAINLPESFLRLGSSSIAGIHVHILALSLLAAGSQIVLSTTVFGRHIMAIGHSVEAAKKTGVPTRRVLFSVYVIAAIFASLGALLSLSQLGTVSPTFGQNREFTAIAAAVVGGTSLFGGRGSVFPGTVLGALLTQTVESGLVMLNADPYLYPMVIATVIFVAVLLDGYRSRLRQAFDRRPIFVR